MEKNKIAWTRKDEIIWKNVIRITASKDMSLAELARLAKTRPQTLNNIRAKLRGIGPNLQRRIANALNVTVDELLIEAVDIPDRYGPIPVISWVQAGEFNHCSDIWPPGVSGEGEPVFSVKKISPSAFALLVEGDSMEPRFMAGDKIVVDPMVYCNSGDFCVVKINEETAFKKLIETETELRLVPLNDKYEERVIKKDSRVNFKIIGKVVDMIPKL